MFLVILVYALFASTFTIGKTGLYYTEPFFFVGTRMLFAGACLVGYQWLFRRESFSFKREHTWRLISLAVFNIYFPFIFEFWGMKYLTSAKTCFLYSISPFLSALFAYFIFSEKLTGKKWIGLVVGFLGFLPILLSETAEEQQVGHLFVFSWAELAIFLAAASSAYGWILLQQLVRDGGYSPPFANGLSMLIGGALALTHSFFTEVWEPFPVTSLLPFIACTALLILISNCICYNLYGVLLKRYSATFMSLAGLSSSLFSALFGWLTLGEQITWSFYVSLGGVCIGLYIFYQEELRNDLAKQRAT